MTSKVKKDLTGFVARQCDGSASADSAASFAEIVGISGCAKDFVKGLGSGSKLRRVGFANDNCAGGLESLDKKRVLRRHEVLVYARAVCGPDTGSQRQVLDGEWETMECSRGRSSRQTRVRLARCTQSFFL